jgi:hypothetical protein
MADFPPRVKLENFHQQDPDRFKLSLRFDKVYVSPEGKISVWLTKEEVGTLNDHCSASLLDDDMTGPV